jgi:hypothetical protein
MKRAFGPRFFACGQEYRPVETLFLLSGRVSRMQARRQCQNSLRMLKLVCFVYLVHLVYLV